MSYYNNNKKKVKHDEACKATFGLFRYKGNCIHMHAQELKEQCNLKSTV